MPLDLDAIYTDLHRHPELSFQETRTAGVITRELAAIGLEYEEGVGRTGVVTAIRNGEGPVVWLRADMDGLPVEELTGLPYASTARGVDPAGTDVPVMHACGHDMHVTALLGALEKLQASREEWSGTVVAVFQPAEEYGAGAQAMIADGVFDRYPKPDIVLGQHLTPLPAGTIGVRPGTQMAASDGLTVKLLGRGGHGSRPHATIDPVVMAAATVMRLQTVVSREVDPREMAVVTVGSIHAGLKNNIIPAEATLELSLRYPDDDARADILARVERIVRAEAAASGAEQGPVISTQHSLPPTINDPASTARLTAALDAAFGQGTVIDPGMFTGSEDVSWFAREAGVPLVYWFWGGVEPQRFADAVAAGTVSKDIPTNHSPYFAPILHPTIERGVDALTVAAREFLA
ncbi:amidohydrolase [Microbacterium sp. EYE_5]|uniref:amidohydrolase n=1 Tax=unclassified Microbacterium TaxID=2609290 RepID=UPI00200417DC|nr:MULTISPECIES: amidohydrolase [unclassified Microbacterium]MCK6079666.1 amidohydrolase [Microbacterium sp. EYE_382]MCK6084937.1 amidohydrolase [Microbacterium sp. EYE_384]MCK6122837.1 amidohydrolase [Microbacterium sp. EYE_80]MCK6125700.1 amidohydrolase [Microbacterium sp. EYE_79]MCK6140621.1 amidohydrolase [Microbacterium sp. EYE_39]